MNKDLLDLMKTVSLVLIAVTLVIIAWRLGEIAGYLYDLVMLS
ncbi:hypothetical protein [Halobacillus sp. Marseille-P3879]|nr:hypothetical protein [Halobacillus sp. Marseille-P3879]